MAKVTVVVGGQYGSESKGKATVHLALQAVARGEHPIGIRGGGANAGHVVYPNGHRYVVRHIPSCVAVPEAQLVICGGAMVNPSLLLKEISEIETLGVSVVDRLFIDYHAGVIDEEHIQQEKDLALGLKVGSTQTGTGAAAAARCLRRSRRVGDVPELRHLMITNTLNFTHHALGEPLHHLFVEGTQGFGLSLFHSKHYPQSTSHDTTAAAFISQAGISPRDVTDICMVIRSFPIRVGGDSGPMSNEITWVDVQKSCGAPEPLTEMTSVTKKVRRVGMFDWILFKKAINSNKPTSIAIHGADYINWLDRGATKINELSDETIQFIAQVEHIGGCPVEQIFTGPLQSEVVEVHP